MANTELFKSTRGRLIPAAEGVNEAGGTAYSLEAKAALAQYLMTGCLNGSFYASATKQLDSILALADLVEPEFLAKAAIHARQKGYMKDTPAFITADEKIRGARRKGFPARHRQRQDVAELRADSSFRSGRTQVAGNSTKASGATLAGECV